MDPKELFSDRDLVARLLATVVLVVVLGLARRAAVGLVRRTSFSAGQTPLRLLAQIRWTALLVFVGGLAVVWAAELRAFALSIAAVAAAAVIATKELITCLLGAAARTLSGAFVVGDRIEIGGLRGDVIAHDVLTTTLLEVGPDHERTGRTVTVPNALLLSQSVSNETSGDDFVIHIVTVPLSTSADVGKAEAALLEAGRAVCAPYLAEAQRHMQATAARHGLPALSVEPAVTVRLPAPDRRDLVLRVPAPARRRGEIEQAILHRTLRG